MELLEQDAVQPTQYFSRVMGTGPTDCIATLIIEAIKAAGTPCPVTSAPGTPSAFHPRERIHRNHQPPRSSADRTSQSGGFGFPERRWGGWRTATAGQPPVPFQSTGIEPGSRPTPVLTLARLALS